MHDSLMLLLSRSSNLQVWLNDDDDSNFAWFGENFCFDFGTYCF